MSKIQEKLNALRPYVVGIRYLQGIQLVDAVFKENWTIPQSEVIHQEKVDGEDNYYMFYSENEDIDIDDLLDYVKEIIDLNIEREKKYELLSEKVAELQKIFKSNNLAKLKKLKFTFSEPDIMPSIVDMDDLSIESTKELISKSEESTEQPKEEVKPKVETPKTTKNGSGKTKTVMNGIELPPKGEKIELEDFEEPKNIVCKCGPNEICPVCEEQKDLTY
jgi:hypothetical protein